MAGVKGRSGGARPGAGRKPKAKPATVVHPSVKVELERQPHGGALKRTIQEPVAQQPVDMLTFLQDVALGLTEASSLQVRAAIAAVQYTHLKKGDGGKKDEIADLAKKAAGGKFRPAAPPLKLVGGG